jgi:hypothetical protein
MVLRCKPHLKGRDFRRMCSACRTGPWRKETICEVCWRSLYAQRYSPAARAISRQQLIRPPPAAWALRVPERSDSPTSQMTSRRQRRPDEDHSHTTSTVHAPFWTAPVLAQSCSVASVGPRERNHMRSLLSVIACAALLLGCASPYENTIDPTTVDSMGASGAGAVALPGDGSSFTNVPPDSVNPVTGAPTP